MSSLDSYKGLLAAGLLGGIAGGAVVASLMQKCVYFNKKKIGLQLSHLQSSNFHLLPPSFLFQRPKKVTTRLRTEAQRSSGIVIHDGLVHISGQVGNIPDLETSDITAQTKQTLQKYEYHALIAACVCIYTRI